MTPDPSARSANPRNPQTWNRYIYTLGDPINHNDPSGLCSYDTVGDYYDDDDHDYAVFPGPCSGGTIGDGAYGINAVDVEMSDGVLSVNGTPISEASLQEDFGAELGAMAFLRSLIGSINGGVATAAVVEGASIWTLPAVARGLAAEEILGANLPAGFPGIDAFADGIATSIKSVNLEAASYQTTSGLQSTLTSYVNNLIDFQGNLEDLGSITRQGQTVTYSEISGWNLDIAIPFAPTAAQQAAITAAQDLAALNGIHLVTTIVP